MKTGDIESGGDSDGSTDDLPDSASSSRCAHCGMALHGTFCAHCGQRAFRGQFTIRRIASSAVAEFFDVERGILFTVKALTVRPGHAIREYVSGHIVPFTNPAKYMVLAYVCAGVTVFSAILSDPPADLPLTVQALVSLPILVMALLVLLLAMFSRLFFARTGARYAEHVILHTYTLAHLTFLFAILGGILLLLGTGPSVPLIVVADVAMLAYLVWASVQFFPVRVASAILRSGAATLLGFGSLTAILYLLIPRGS